MIKTVPNAIILESKEFDDLQLLDEWFKYEWGDDHDPVPDDVNEVTLTELPEDYEVKDISQLEKASSREVQCRISPTELR